MDPTVRSFLRSAWESDLGNPHNLSHAAGRAAADEIKNARKRVASLFGASAEDVTFTSGATEANNLAIFGSAAASFNDFRLVTTTAEHVSVVEPCRELSRRENTHVSVVPVDSAGKVDWDELEAELACGTDLLSVLLVNNETGAWQPIEKLYGLARHYGCPLHLDATQAVGRVDTSALWSYSDLISVSAHKLGGPVGIGALICDPNRVRPMLLGGNQQELRSGTIPAVLTTAFGIACEQRHIHFNDERDRLLRLSSRIQSRLQPHGRIVSPTDAAPGILCVCFAGIEAETIQAMMDDVAVSSGSACSSGTVDSSHVLRAMGIADSDAICTIRISINAQTTDLELELGLDRILETVTAIRNSHSASCCNPNPKKVHQT